MCLINYISVLVSFFKDRRIIANIEQLIKEMIEKKTTRLHTVTKDKNEYNRFKSLIRWFSKISIRLRQNIRCFERK